jgi:hypothetical protein
VPRWLERLLLGLGVTLLLGGAAHLAGVAHLYATQRVPEANRVLLDWWIGQAQLVGGGLYVAAARAIHRGAPARAIAVAGALVVVGYSAAFLPVLVSRAPAHFWIPVSAYLVASAVVMITAAKGAAAAAQPR